MVRLYALQIMDTKILARNLYHPAAFAIKAPYIFAFRHQCSKQYTANVMDYNPAQNKLQIKATLILSPMLVSVEYQYPSFQLYCKCRKVTSPADKGSKEAWFCKEVPNIRMSGGLD